MSAPVPPSKGERLLGFLTGLKDVFATKVQPQQEPHYADIKGLDSQVQQIAIELFYKADKWADAKEAFLQIAELVVKAYMLHLFFAWVNTFTP